MEKLAQKQLALPVIQSLNNTMNLMHSLTFATLCDEEDD